MTQLSLVLMTTLGLMTTAHAEIGSDRSYLGLMLLSTKEVKVGIQGVLGSNLTGFGHLKYKMPDYNGIYTLTGSQIPMPAHRILGVWSFKQLGSSNIYFGDWAREEKDSAGAYTQKANPATHTVFYIGENADSSITSTGTATYNVTGVTNAQHYAGTYQADFGAKTLTGSLTDGVDTLNIGHVRIETSDATISGETASWSGANRHATDGYITGQFFNQQKDILGLAQFDDRSLDIAFGGSQ